MWSDLLKKQHPNESTRVLVARRIYTIISSFLLVAVFVILCKEMHDEAPGVKTTFKPVDNLPVPDIRFAWDQNFTITCEIINQGGELIQNQTECTKRNILQSIYDGFDFYNGSFLPKENLNFNNQTGGTSLIRIFLDTTGSFFNSTPIVMQAFDPGYSDIRGNLDYTTNGSRTYQFAQELFYKNDYLLTNSDPNNTSPEYWWMFSKHIRYTIVENALAYIGFPRHYNQPYLESSIQFTPLIGNSSNSILLIVSPQSFESYIIVEEYEQKNKTIASILGNLGGVLSGITFFYVLLFGAELISPWGYAQTLLRDRPKLDEYPKKGKDDVEKITQENSEDDIGKRIRNLEDRRDFYENYIINMPPATKP